jgi:transposase-like protein
VEIQAAYMGCPHCQQEIRAGLKYIGHKVVCKHCGGHLQLQAESG